MVGQHPRLRPIAEDTTVRNIAAIAKIPSPPGIINTPAVTSSSSAATRVFNIPELLEIILLDVADFAPIAFTIKEAATSSHRRHYQTPAKRLFALQRVNSFFRNTINGSTALRRRMFLEATTPPDNIPPDLIQTTFQDSFEWMMTFVGVNLNDNCMLYGRPEKLKMDIPWQGEQNVSRSKNASWRDMKLHCIKGRGPFNVNVCPTVRTFYSVHTFLEEDEMTLGKLHDGLMALMPALMKFRQVEERIHDDRLFKDCYKKEKRYNKRVLKAASKLVQEQCDRDDLWE